MLVCVRAAGVWRICFEDEAPDGIPVRSSLFPEYDLEAARNATHMVLDSTLPEVVYLGSEAHTKQALASCLERGSGFTMAPVKGLGV